MAPSPKDLLCTWLERQISPAALSWLQERAQKISVGDRQTFFLSFGMVPRKTGKELLRLSSTDLQQADMCRPDWQPHGWSVDQAARSALLLFLPAESRPTYLEILNQTFAAGEVGELVALYQALPLLPFPEAHALRAAEGIRTSMTSVFAAVSQHNPYPCEQLDEGPWNQMILKCLFVGLPLDPVVGIDRRANPALARMLVDYAHERWAAKRAICPELWRPVGPFADKRAIADLRRVLSTGNELERQAAVLALQSAPGDAAKRELELVPELAAAAEREAFSWATISREWLAAQRV